MMRKSMIVAAMVALSGCAAQLPPTADEMATATEPLICHSTAECNLWWRRAQLWVVTNSPWKIQTATDVVIETYNGDQYTPLRHYVITLEPMDGTNERIWITSGCQNTFVCRGDPYVIGANFKAYVRGASK